MNRAHKAARFVFVNYTVAIILIIPVYLFMLPKLEGSRALALMATMGLCSLSLFVPVIFKKLPTQFECDERDKMIDHKGALGGFLSAYLFVGLTCMLPFFIMGPKANISVAWLPCIFMGAGIMQFFMRSIITLVMYGKGGQSNE